MSAEKMTSHKVFMAWEYDREEAFLNEMSRKGWELVTGGCYHSVFEKESGKQYRYCLDYNPQAMNSAEEKQRYVQTFADDGWEFINSTYNGWIYLRKEIRDGMTDQDFEIYSDRESMMELFGRLGGLLKTMCFILAIVLFLEIYLYIRGKMAVILIFAAVILAVFVWLICGINRLKELQRRQDRQLR